MTIQEIKSVYTAGLEAIVENGADEVRKHNRKTDVNIFMERGCYWVQFDAPVHVHFGDGTIRKNVAEVTVTYWHNDDLKEEGTEYFDDPKAAMRFLKSAVRNPKRVLKKMDTYLED